MNHMDIHGENRDDPVSFDEAINEYWINVPGYPNVRQQIYFCPWCGEKLPESHGDEWYSLLEAKGIDPLVDEIPKEFQSSEWRLKR